MSETEPDTEPNSKFTAIITDFTRDLSITFPEYTYLWSSATVDIDATYKHCLAVYPERFFDILYQNAEIFVIDNSANTMFLPNVEFKMFYNLQGVSEQTKQTIWRYLQLILVSIMAGIQDKTTFGETANMFDGIDENDFQEKLNEMMNGLTDFFTKAANSENGENNDSEIPDLKNMFDPSQIPNMDDLQNHLKDLFEGKIGQMAREMSEEISKEMLELLDDGTGTIKTTADVLQKMMKNPKKMMDVLKKVGEKLEAKMASGDISKEEMLNEAASIMAKFKEMGADNGQIGDMIKKLMSVMGKGLGKGGKFDMNAMNRMTQQENTKDRLRNKLAARKQKLEAQIHAKQQQLVEQQQLLSGQTTQTLVENGIIQSTDEPDNYVFQIAGEETQTKSSRPNNKKKSKKGKK
jgi:hypothetical protein